MTRVLHTASISNVEIIKFVVNNKDSKFKARYINNKDEMFNMTRARNKEIK